MSDYKELVKDLRSIANGTWRNSEYTWFGDEGTVFADAAAAIEALQAELAGSKDAIRILNHNLEMKKPKRGEWIWIQKANGGQYKGCSVCHAPIPTDSNLDYIGEEDNAYCYSCGAKMEVQDGSSR